MSRTRGLDPYRRLANYHGQRGEVVDGVAADVALTPKQRRRAAKKARTLGTRWSGRAQR